MGLISVVIPVFNRPHGARRAVASVLAQQDLGANNVEIIVVDDCSEPPLDLSGADQRVQLLRLARNSGAAAARNAGIRATRGEFVALLDSDDVWLPGKLAAQLQTMADAEAEQSRRGASGPIAVVCGFYCPDRRSGKLQWRMPVPAASVEALVSGCWYNPGSALLLHRSAYETVGLLDEGLGRLEDLDWFIRFGQVGGRLVVAPVLGAVVAPSNSGDPAIIVASTRTIEAKFRPGGAAGLQPAAWRKLQAYLALERGAAHVRAGAWLAGGSQIVASMALMPRLHASVGRFWQRGSDIPADVATRYAGMVTGPR